MVVVQAGLLQKLVSAKKDKNKRYKQITSEAGSIQGISGLQPYEIVSSWWQINKLKEQAKERIDLAKALIRASEKNNNPEKTKAVDGDESGSKSKKKVTKG